MDRKDIHLNEIGDIEVGYDGDIACSIGDDVLVDSIIFRLKTYAGDYELEPLCGASLEDLVGQPNTREIGGRAEDMVIDALTHDGFLTEDQITVRVSPLAIDTLLLAITVQGDRGNYSVMASLDLKTGLVNVKS